MRQLIPPIPIHGLHRLSDGISSSVYSEFPSDPGPFEPRASLSSMAWSERCRIRSQSLSSKQARFAGIEGGLGAARSASPWDGPGMCMAEPRGDCKQRRHLRGRRGHCQSRTDRCRCRLDHLLGQRGYRRRRRGVVRVVQAVVGVDYGLDALSSASTRSSEGIVGVGGGVVRVVQAVVGVD